MSRIAVECPHCRKPNPRFKRRQESKPKDITPVERLKAAGWRVRDEKDETYVPRTVRRGS